MNEDFKKQFNEYCKVISERTKLVDNFGKTDLFKHIKNKVEGL